MLTSTEYPRTPHQVKGELRRLGITQGAAAQAIHKSEAMVSYVLRGLAKSRPVLDAIRTLIAARQPTDGTPPAA